MSAVAKRVAPAVALTGALSLQGVAASDAAFIAGQAVQRPVGDDAKQQVAGISAAAPAAETVNGASSGSMPIVGAFAVAAALSASRRGRARRVRRAAAEKVKAVAEMAQGAQEEDLDLEAAASKADGEVEVKTQPLDLPNAVPFLGAPGYREFAANVPGDSGFDPLNICTDEQTFIKMRDAELKHARLAMLAAAGWPLSELAQPSLAKLLGMKSDLASGGLAPSVLNGGLFDSFENSSFLILFLVLAGVIDGIKPLPWMKPYIGTPGDYGFDPLAMKDVTPPGFPLFGALPAGRNWMAEAELKNGRLAMVAITAYAAQEFVTKVPVVDETPFFFRPPFFY